MKNYQESSRDAYEAVKPNISQARTKVLEAIRTLGTCSDKQIAEHLNWPINRVTPRRLELKQLDLIFSTGKTKNENGISVLMWSEAKQQSQAA